ncbi:MAG: Gfo/Idh/MocA family protein, partial [Planctomycetota bacterium]
TLAAVMDIDEEAAREVAEAFGGAAWTTDVADLLARDDVDAVYIATPAYVHAQQARAAVRAGKHALVEKPVALSVTEARQIASAAEEAGVTVGVGFMMRHHGAHRKIKQLVDEGAIGTPVLGRAQLSCWYPPIEGAWRQDPARGGGGAFIDLGNHCFDLLEMFLGKTVAVHAFTGHLVHDYASEDTALVTFRFDSGALGVVDSLFNVPDESSKNVLELYGSAGSIRCEGTIGQAPGGTVRLVAVEGGGYDAQQQRQASTEQEVAFEEINTYRAEIEDFTDAIDAGRPPACPLADGLWNMQVVEAAYRSAQTGCTVEVG